MSGRRSHVRFGMMPAAEGRLRLLRDVVVQRVEKGHVTAISREPGIVGETITIEVPKNQTTELVRVRIVESCPLIAEGHIRHRLQLQAIVEPPAPART